jgi:hypothetical protein
MLVAAINIILFSLADIWHHVRNKVYTIRRIDVGSFTELTSNLIAKMMATASSASIIAHDDSV